MVWQDWVLGSLYLAALAIPPASLGFAWWGWFRQAGIQHPKWRAVVFLSGVLASTANFVLWWGWVIWLRFHFTTESWKVREPVSNVAICLLFYSILAAIAGKGPYRVLIGISAVLAILPWIPVGVL
jgi:hypothetical protein